MNTYPVRTVSKMIDRSSGSEKNKICFKGRFSTTPKILANEMVNEFSNQLLFIKFHFYKVWSFLGFSNDVMASLNSGL
jgi:hypothetical protein